MERVFWGGGVQILSKFSFAVEMFYSGYPAPPFRLLTLIFHMDHDWQMSFELFAFILILLDLLLLLSHLIINYLLKNSLTSFYIIQMQLIAFSTRLENAI